MKSVVRTPDERFSQLPDFPYQPHYCDDLRGYRGLRVHYIDEGRDPANANQPVFLCLHGQPTWSYLYRKMLPEFVQAGGRVVAPDLLGFGRSDKPTDERVYTYEFHRSMLIAFIERLELTNITLVCQDWGGILGLSIPPQMPSRFARLIVMNTTLPVGESLGEGFAAWKAFNRTRPDLDIGALMKRSEPSLSAAEAAAYAAPFPDKTYKSGVRQFPELVMVRPDMPGVSISQHGRQWWKEKWRGQSFMAIGMLDPVLGEPIMRDLQATINGCPEPMLIENGGHFVQEHGAPIARAALEYFANT